MSTMAAMGGSDERARDLPPLGPEGVLVMAALIGVLSTRYRWIGDDGIVELVELVEEAARLLKIAQENGA